MSSEREAVRDDLAVLLVNCGWTDKGDAQWSRLLDALPSIRALADRLTSADAGPGVAVAWQMPAILRPDNKWEVEPIRCKCHPETCCCQSHCLLLNGEPIAEGDPKSLHRIYSHIANSFATPTAAPAGVDERAVEGECIEAGNDEEGQPRILVHCTREALRDGPALPYRRVRVTVLP